MRKYFKPEVTLYQALLDSWARDLPGDQVIKECSNDFGIVIDYALYLAVCRDLERQMEADLSKIKE